MNKTIIFSLLLLLAACTYTLKVKDGKTAYSIKQYAVATKLLPKEIEKAKTKSDKNKKAFLLAESYNALSQPEKAAKWYKFAYDNGYGSDALKGLAYSLKKNGQYAEAKETFKQLGLEVGSPYEYRKEMTACTVSEIWIKDSIFSEFHVQPLAVNTGFAEYSPVVLGARHLMFTSDRGAAAKKEKYNWTGNAFSDLYESKDGQSATKTQLPFNTDGNDGTICFSENGSEVYFTSCNGSTKNDIYCKLMFSRKIGTNWIAPEPMPFCEGNVNYGHPALTADGNTLYFTCNKSDGWGGYDIYRVLRYKGNWSVPELLGRSVNTTQNEMFPTIDSDTLYFASDGHSGMGGLDIFKSYKNSKESWTPAINLKAPINSSGDDFSFVIDRQTPRDSAIWMLGYLTSNRQGGVGNDDLFQFTKGKPLERPVPADTAKNPPTHRMILDGYVLEKIYENPDDPNSKVKARKPLNNAEVNVGFGSNKMLNFKTGDDGYFTLELQENTEYLIYAFKDNYLRSDTRFSTVGIAKDNTQPVQRYEVELVLDQIYKNKEIILENIYYDYDKSDIRDDAKPTLNKLARTLLQNPNIKIQLSSHTDCRGNEGYNEELSQQRAQSAVDYLISQGIEAKRLIAKGYGESLLAVKCNCTDCTEAQHQVNRRTTFKIVE